MYQDPTESCAKRIRKALDMRNMKQSELCRKTKIATSAMSEYLRGLYEPKQDKIYLMSEALNVDPVWLMGFDVPMEKEGKKVSPHEDLTGGIANLSAVKKELVLFVDELNDEQAALALRVLKSIVGELE